MGAVIFTAYCFIYIGNGALGAPTQSWQPPLNDTVAMWETVAPPWVSAPPTRGTFEILYSCTFTLALCVYSAIHLNIPTKESLFSYYRRKTKWVLVALFAPEVVLYIAWYQWHQARQFCRTFNAIVARKAKSNAASILGGPEDARGLSTTQLIGDDRLRIDPVEFPDESSQTQSKEVRSITLLDGFYATMGGYVVDLPIFNAGKSVRRSTITPAGIILLAKNDVFPITSHQAIQDKSKADLLAKILVCFQVSFLVIQSGARKAGGYPLTLLEVHTLVHVVCALMMYALWFHKPLNIQDPTVVEATQVVISCFNSEISDRSRYLRSRSWNIILYTREDGSLFLLMLGLFALCLAYGGVHLSAWSFHFPTQAEHYLWKAACLMIICGSFAAPAWVHLSSISDYVHEQHDLREVVRESINILKGWWHNLNHSLGLPWRGLEYLVAFLVTIGVIATPLFLLSRIVIVIEAFLSLRSVPAGAYAAIEWAHFIPHV